MSAQNNTVSALAYQRQRVSRAFIEKLSHRKVKAIQQNGLYAIIAIKSICTTFSLNGSDNQPIHAKISTHKLKQMLKVKTFKDLAILLYKLSDMGLIEWEYSSFDGKVHITDLTLSVEDCCNSARFSQQMREQQNGAIAKGVGFFFVDKSIQERFADKGRFSEVDITTDLWLSSVYQDDTIKLSRECPLVAFSQANKVIITHKYSELANRYHCSASRLHDIMQHLQKYGFIQLRSYQNIGTYILVPMFSALISKIDSAVPKKAAFKSVVMTFCTAICRAFSKVAAAFSISDKIPVPTDEDAPPLSGFKNHFEYS